MNTGDIIELNGRRWHVGVFHREVRTFTVYDVAGKPAEVPNDIEHKVIANPAKGWPFAVAKEHRSWGNLTQVVIPGRDPLQVLTDWAPGNPGRQGGSIFLNPALGLRLGDTINLQYSSGRAARVTIKGSFATVEQRVERLNAKPKEPKTAFDHLMMDDDEDTP
jgi:hypothetical protein